MELSKGEKLELEELTKYFGNFCAVDHLTLTVQPGEFLCLLGPSGCGKTTTLNMIAGLLEPTYGRILIGGRDVTYLPPKERKVGLVFQSYAVFTHMTVYENLAFGLKIRKLTKEEIDKKVKQVAHILQLEDVLHVKGGNLNLDQTQRTALGRALIIEPAFFLLDEPLSNLDPALRAVMRVKLKQLQKELSQTVVYVTHDQLEAMSMADRIAVMNAGKLQQIGTPDEVYNKPANKFVANFIGSPTMNFIDCSLAEKNGHIILDAGDFTLDVTRFGEILKKETCGPEVIMGIRPEHIQVSREPVKNAIKGKVALVEPLGTETILTMRVGGKEIKTLLLGTYRASIGEELYLIPNMDRLHIIDKKTEKVVV
ncbi:MAG: ABC transporter ATP-binding protein [Candidatus Bathyarchaeia archaeon]